MAEKKISEQLFEAMDVIIGKRLEAVQKDKTILCVVEDASKASEGQYTVAYGSTKFTAYSENTKYLKNQNVWVLIPDGDYNNDKLIVSKYTKDSASPYIWVSPLDSYANITSNVLNGSFDFTLIEEPANTTEIPDQTQVSPNVGLIANYSAPVNIFTGQTLGNDGAGARITDEDVVNNLLTSDSNTHFNDVPLAGYNRLGISAEFKTDFSTNQPISGNYGLLFIVTTKIIIDTGVAGDDRYTETYRYIPIVFDSTKMWGNPYNYADYSLQSMCYDIDPAKNGTPIWVDCYFYQNFDFISENNEEYPFDYNGIVFEPNLFVRNINMSFGYAVDSVDDDTLYLFTTSNNTYAVDNFNYTKNLQTRFIFVGDDNERIAINSQDGLTDYLTQDGSPLKPLAPMIRWYRYNLTEGVADLRAGDV